MPLRRTGLGGPKVRATDGQRAWVRGRACLVCGRQPVQPAHIVPQWYRRCRHDRGVVPLCHECHVKYDWRGMNLLDHLTEEFAEELAHALTHVTEEELERGLTGGGWGDPGNERSGRNGTTRDPRPRSA